MIAAAVITFAVLLWRGLRLPGHRGTDAVAGFAAGILSTSTGTSGPPIVIALGQGHAADGVPSDDLGDLPRAGFGCPGRVRAGGSGHHGRARGRACRSPGLVLGSIVGERGFRRLDASTFRTVVLGLLFVSGLVALLGAVWSNGT